MEVCDACSKVLEFLGLRLQTIIWLGVGLVVGTFQKNSVQRILKLHLTYKFSIVA